MCSNVWDIFKTSVSYVKIVFAVPALFKFCIFEICCGCIFLGPTISFLFYYFYCITSMVIMWDIAGGVVAF